VATVQTGLFGTKESFVPLAQADLTDDGLSVPYTKDQVKDAAHRRRRAGPPLPGLGG